MSQESLGSGPKIAVCQPTKNTHFIFYFCLSGTEIQTDKRTEGDTNTIWPREHVPLRLGHKNLQFPLSLLKVGSVGTRLVMTRLVHTCSCMECQN